MAASLLGIFRETLHSPDRVFDDHEILRLTGEELRKKGLAVDFVKPEEIAADRAWWDRPRPELVFLMCEQERMLEPLSEWERKGTILVNSVEAIRNTYRYRMVPLISGAGVPFPKSELILSVTPHWEKHLKLFQRNGDFKPLWIKRGDVHNTQKGDVTLARSPEEVRLILLNFQSRGVAQAVLQENIEGDLVKFYGVGQSGETWFKWFYHKHQDLKNYKFSEDALKAAFFGAAQALGIDVFGGDAVVAADGSVTLIDINAWPSFALFRNDAAPAIARHIHSKIADPVS